MLRNVIEAAFYTDLTWKLTQGGCKCQEVIVRLFNSRVMFYRHKKAPTLSRLK